MSGADDDLGWYQIAPKSEPLSQGDLIVQCPVIELPDAKVLAEKPSSLDLTIAVYDVVIVSQSCDLDHGKLKSVMVCPVYDLDKFAEWDANFKTARTREELRRGYLPGYHMLAECKLAGFERPTSVVDFHSIYPLPLDLLKALVAGVEARLQLQPPYTEHLSQAFGRYFMRVALPRDIPKFK
jgi:hypothetical protein